MITNHITDVEKHVGDVASIGALIGVFMNWLPQATAIVTFIWVCIRLYETDTIQRILKHGKHKNHHHHRR